MLISIVHALYHPYAVINNLKGVALLRCHQLVILCCLIPFYQKLLIWFPLKFSTLRPDIDFNAAKSLILFPAKLNSVNDLRCSIPPKVSIFSPWTAREVNPSTSFSKGSPEGLSIAFRTTSSKFLSLNSIFFSAAVTNWVMLSMFGCVYKYFIFYYHALLPILPFYEHLFRYAILIHSPFTLDTSLQLCPPPLSILPEWACTTEPKTKQGSKAITSITVPNSDLPLLKIINLYIHYTH